MTELNNSEKHLQLESSLKDSFKLESEMLSAIKMLQSRERSWQGRQEEDEADGLEF